MTTEVLLQALTQDRIIAIVRLADASVDELVRIGSALATAGVGVVEFPMTNWNALHAIEKLRIAYPTTLVGAGTVLTASDVDDVASAGARFVVAPNVDERVIERALESGLPIIPGALTPTEIALAHTLGSVAVKVFPAGPLTPSYVAALRGPFPDIRLIPTGGVGIDDVAPFIRAGALAIGLGSDLIGDGSTETVTENAQRTREAIRETGTS